MKYLSGGFISGSFIKLIKSVFFPISILDSLLFDLCKLTQHCTLPFECEIIGFNLEKKNFLKMGLSIQD